MRTWRLVSGKWNLGSGPSGSGTKLDALVASQFAQTGDC